VHRLLLLLEQVLEVELAPSAAAGVHQRATLVELSQCDGCEPELRQKDDPVAALDDLIGSQVAATR
jgi:hypothetical protein